MIYTWHKGGQTYFLRENGLLVYAVNACAGDMYTLYAIGGRDSIFQIVTDFHADSPEYAQAYVETLAIHPDEFALIGERCE